MTLSRVLLTLLSVLLLAGCSEPQTPPLPGGDDAGAEPPLDFPLGETPETLVAETGAQPESSRHTSKKT